MYKILLFTIILFLLLGCESKENTETNVEKDTHVANSKPISESKDEPNKSDTIEFIVNTLNSNLWVEHNIGSISFNEKGDILILDFDGHMIRESQVNKISFSAVNKTDNEGRRYYKLELNCEIDNCIKRTWQQDGSSKYDQSSAFEMSNYPTAIKLEKAFNHLKYLNTGKKSIF